MLLRSLFATIQIWFSSALKIQQSLFLYEGNVSYDNKSHVLEEHALEENMGSISYCAILCRRNPQCNSIEMCIGQEKNVCRLCNGVLNTMTGHMDTENLCHHCRMVEENREDELDNSSETYMEDCQGVNSSGVFNLTINGTQMTVWCEKRNVFAFVAIQRRINGSLDFNNRTWKDYEDGFGDVCSEFWLGNKNIHLLTSSGLTSLRIDLVDILGDTGFEKYNDGFQIGSAGDMYRLNVSQAGKGASGDSLSELDGQQFTTKDVDNDGDGTRNCAVDMKGAWWFKFCKAHLNGMHGTNTLNWLSWSKGGREIQQVLMLLRKPR